jgi:hypothetical protein
MYHAAMGAMQGMNLQQIYARIEDVLWDTQKVTTLSIAWCCGVRRRRMCDLVISVVETLSSSSHSACLFFWNATGAVGLLGT